MLVRFGNARPIEQLNGQTALMERDAPCITYANLHDYKHDVGNLTTDQLKSHLIDSMTQRGNVTRLGEENEAVLAMLHPNGIVATHSMGAPTWISSDDQQFADFLASYYGCPTVGIDELGQFEDTYHTLAGPPGVVPMLGATMQITQNGRDIVARGVGGGQVGFTGQATGSSSTSLTDSGASWTSNQWAGCRVFASVSATQMVFGIIVSNTSTALTVDQWYTIATPGGAAGSTPSSTATFVITDGNAPAWFVGISTSSTAPAGSPPDTHSSLTSEIATSGGGLIRKIAPYAHTASANTWTYTPVYTANGTDSLPAVIASYGVFDSMVVGATPTMLYYNTISPTATIAASGDQLTLTITATTT